MEDLHPLRKLHGVNVNKESRARLPNLLKTTADYADDLLMAVDELFEPDEALASNEAW